MALDYVMPPLAPLSVPVAEPKKADQDAIATRLKTINQMGFTHISDLVNRELVYREDSVGCSEYYIADLEGMINGLASSQTVSNYVAFSLGHEIGALNDKYRFRRLLTKIQTDLPARPSREAIFHEITYEQGSTAPASLELEYRTAAFNRGYDRAMQTIQRVVENLSNTVDGTESIDMPETFATELSKMSAEQVKQVNTLLSADNLGTEQGLQK